MKQLQSSYAIVLFALGLLYSQPIQISGVVQDVITGKGVSGVVVKLPSYVIPGKVMLLGTDTLTARTDVNGAFTITNGSTVSNKYQGIYSNSHRLRISNNQLNLFLNQPQQVSIQVSSLDGKKLYSSSKDLLAGNHALKLPNLKMGISVYRISVGRQTLEFKLNSSGKVTAPILPVESTSKNFKTASSQLNLPTKSVLGTIYTNHPNYIPYTSFVDTLVTSGVVIKLQPTSVPPVLPSPSQTPPLTSKPVKVFILLGQSNMIGYGQVDPDTVKGTLAYQVRKRNEFPWALDSKGSWAVRNDVWATNVLAGVRNGRLSVGFGNGGTRIGVEYGLGQVLGNYFDEEVMLIKSSMGNRSLGWDILPPGSPRYDYKGRTYAGYGDSTQSWPIGASQKVIDSLKVKWYAGLQYDAFVKSVHDVLDNLPSRFTEYKNQGYEIAGFVWWQGDKDVFTEAYASRYELNLVTLIKALRKEFNAPNAKMVIGTYIKNGWNLRDNSLQVANGQLAVSGDRGKYPEFVNNVMTVEGRDFYRDKSISPKNEDYHENWNAETYVLLGTTMGKAMVELMKK